MRFFKLNSDEINETDSQTESKKNSKFHMPEVRIPYESFFPVCKQANLIIFKYLFVDINGWPT